MKNDSELELWKELLYYDPQKGLLFWRYRQEHHFPLNKKRKENWNNKFYGQIAGSLNGNGYVQIMYGDSKYRVSAHRLIWAFHYGHWPNGEIDHINRNRKDNRIINLREVSQSINYKNAIKPNPLGERNISIRGNNYQVRVRKLDGKRITVGTFKTLQDAINARNDAEMRYGYVNQNSYGHEKYNENEKSS